MSKRVSNKKGVRKAPARSRVRYGWRKRVRQPGYVSLPAVQRSVKDVWNDWVGRLLNK